MPCDADAASNGNCIGATYVVQVRAYNVFGHGAWSEESYAVKTHGPPTKPLGLEIAVNSQSTVNPGTAYSRQATSVGLAWAAPTNFATGTDDCVDPATYSAGAALAAGKRSDVAAATSVSAEKLRCAMKPVTEIQQDCGGQSSGYAACVTSSASDWGGFYDCGYVAGTALVGTTNTTIVPAR